MESGVSNSNSGIVFSKQREPFEGIKLENPFTLKVGQVFTGFGIGCGVGIGVGRPINLSAVPMLNQVMTATRGATDAFAGVNRHVNTALRKMGAKNIEAGIGCGVGLGHGFGVGLALKPRFLNQIQSCLVQMMTAMMMKLRMAPSWSMSQGALPASLHSKMNPNNELLKQNPLGNVMNLRTKVPDHTSPGRPGYEKVGAADGSGYKKIFSKSTDTSFGRTEEVLSSFLQNPILKEEDSDNGDMAGRLQSEKNLLRMVLKHDRVIEELMEENQRLRQILVEDLKVPPSKLNINHLSIHNKSPCSECFNCRRKQRRK